MDVSKDANGGDTHLPTQNGMAPLIEGNDGGDPLVNGSGVGDHIAEGVLVARHRSGDGVEAQGAEGELVFGNLLSDVHEVVDQFVLSAQMQLATTDMHKWYHGCATLRRLGRGAGSRRCPGFCFFCVSVFPPLRVGAPLIQSVETAFMRPVKVNTPLLEVLKYKFAVMSCTSRSMWHRLTCPLTQP